MRNRKIMFIYTVLALVMALAYTYFFGCSPLKDICFTYGAAGKVIFIGLMLAFGAGSLGLIYRYMGRKNDFLKERFTNCLREFQVERKELIALGTIVLIGGGAADSRYQLGRGSDIPAG